MFKEYIAFFFNSCFLTTPLFILLFIITIIILLNEKLYTYYFSTAGTILVFALVFYFLAKKEKTFGSDHNHELDLVNTYGISFSFNADNLSLYFLILTAFMMPICVFGSFSIIKSYTEFICYLLLLEIFLIISFVTTNLVIFYIFFESVLIPMFLLVNK